MLNQCGYVMCCLCAHLAVTSQLFFILLFSAVVNILIMATHQAASPPPCAASSADYIIPSILFFFGLPRGGTCVRDIDWVPSCHHLLFAAALFLPVLACAADGLHCRPTAASFFLLNTAQTYLVAQLSNHSTIKQQNTSETPTDVCLAQGNRRQSHIKSAAVFM